MRISDEKAAWQLYAKYGGALRGPIEAHMRKMGVPPDPAVVTDVARDACTRYLKLPPEAPPKVPLLYLVGIARNLVKARYQRAPMLSSPTRIGSGLVSIEDTAEKDLNHLAEDPTQTFANAIDLRDALQALETAKPDEHRVLSGLMLEGKSIADLQRELKAERYHINNLRRRGLAHLHKHLTRDTGKEKKS